jgi:hypothetical protein
MMTKKGTLIVGIHHVTIEYTGRASHETIDEYSDEGVTDHDRYTDKSQSHEYYVDKRKEMLSG